VADAPELILRRTLAQLLHTNALAVYAPTGALPALGVKLDGEFPTVDEFTSISSPPTTADGFSDNVVYRAQFFTRRIGSPIVVEKWANDLKGILNRKEYTPSILGISWAWEMSRTYFEKDTQGRVGVAVTYGFRGREQ
jgi:hypothetical protein